MEMSSKSILPFSRLRPKGVAVLAGGCLLLLATFYILPTPNGTRQLNTNDINNDSSDANGNNHKKSNNNMVLILLDQWRYDWDGMHKDRNIPLQMPFLRRMAGMRFTQAYVPTPLCAPVRACLASGKEYDFAGVLTNQALLFPLTQTTFYKLLRDKGGYHTMMVGKDDLYPQDVHHPTYPGAVFPKELYDLGFSDARRCVSKTRVLKEVPPFDLYRKYLEDLPDINGFKALDVYRDCFHGIMAMNENETATSKCTTDTFGMELYTDEFIHEQALEVLQERPTDKPFFLQVNFAGPHPPNFIPADMTQNIQGRVWPPPVDNEDPDRWSCPLSSSGRSPQFGGRCSYAAELEQLDKYMESIISLVDLDETTVCITGDHGEMLGDHGIGGKKVPHQPSISVPLVCFGAGVVKEGTYVQPVTTLDLVGTILEVANVPPAPDMTVQSLWPIMSLSSTSSASVQISRKVIHSGLGNWRVIVQVHSEKDDDDENSSYKLVCCKGKCPHAATNPLHTNNGWQVLLYDTQKDPNDMETLHESHSSIVRAMIPNLPAGWCRDYHAPAAAIAGPDIIDARR